MLLGKTQIDSTTEEKIVVGMVASTDFLRDISRVCTKETFSIPEAAKVAEWCLKYFKQFKEAPGDKGIMHIYDTEPAMREDERRIMYGFLNRVCTDAKDCTNIEFIKSIAIEHIKKQALRSLCSKATSLVDKGNIQEAEAIVLGFHKIYLPTSGFVDPLEATEISDYFIAKTNKLDEALVLPGDLGTLIGPLKHKWLVGIMGPAKRGKTFWLMEIAIQAMLYKRHALFVSLEMDEQRIKDRMYKRLTGLSDKEGHSILPTLDCIHNQNGSCSLPIRASANALLDADGRKPRYSPSIAYTPCTACKGTSRYSPATWFTDENIGGMRPGRATKVLSGIKGMHGSLKIRSYPAFSASATDIKNDIANLFAASGYVPDVVVVDYADILAPENQKLSGRERMDEVWKMLKNLADSMCCLVVTASQSNRASFGKKFISSTDVAEDIRKIAHVDIMLALNQTPDEKDASIMRVGVVAKRDGEFSAGRTAIVLQHLETGQVLLESVLVGPRQ